MREKSSLSNTTFSEKGYVAVSCLCVDLPERNDILIFKCSIPFVILGKLVTTGKQLFVYPKAMKFIILYMKLFVFSAMLFSQSLPWAQFSRVEIPQKSR